MRTKLDLEECNLETLYSKKDWKDYKPVSVLAEELGVHPSTILWRVKQGKVKALLLYNLMLVRGGEDGLSSSD